MKCFTNWFLNFIVIYAFIIHLPTTLSNDVSVQEKLPFCDTSGTAERHLFVSTLDGQVTALDANNDGSILWSVNPSSQPMLSSSIHKLELTNYGHLVRMIPSLNGGLYKFNGESVEPIPLSAEHLLQASFRYSDDLVISGGKESYTMGVSVGKGEIMYECSMRGCNEEETQAAGDVLIIQRQSQVVRAVEPRTGAERWNFSVAQHDLKLLSECHSTGEPVNRLNLKVIIPDGLICAIDSKHPGELLWKQKFDSPIVSVWEVLKGQVFPVDLFSLSTKNSESSPSLYIGMHEKQLYIQESINMLMKRQELTASYGQKQITYDKEGPVSLPWRPLTVNAKNLGIEGAIEPNENDTALEEAHTTALSVLYQSSFVEGSGFYLYNKDETSNALCNITISSEEPEEEEIAPVTVVIVSLWYWWKEVMVISLATAVFFHWALSMRSFRPPIASKTNSSSFEKQNNSDSGVVLEVIPLLESESQKTKEYNSRYLTDFDPVHCLGHGGFGVVFEAKNKIDDCHYAIKRITLPDAVEQRERVMREVKALAKLDHHNIVRYFNAWLEDPPPGWQQEQDLTWKDCFGYSDGAAMSSLISETTSGQMPSMSKSSRLTPPLHKEESDSFIVFESHSHSTEDETEENSKLDHSIRIESSQSSCKNKQPSKRLRKSLECVERDLCHSPSKVYLYIQMQLCQRESLKDWLLKNPTRSYDEVIRIFEQIVLAVEYVHLRSLIHRDLKPSNIFFSLDQQIKVGDFGLVTSITEEVGRASPPAHSRYPHSGGHTAQVGTQLYMSPEQLSGKSYSYKVDIFSLGMILFELLVPFGTQMERLKILQDIKQQKFPTHFIDKYKNEYELLKLMLSHVPDERPTTIGLRNRPPLLKDKAPEDGDWQFQLPTNRREETSRISTSSTSSD